MRDKDNPSNVLEFDLTKFTVDRLSDDRYGEDFGRGPCPCGCGSFTGDPALCTECGQCFKTVSLFDAHRRKDSCLSINEMKNKGWTQTKRGHWKWPAAEANWWESV